MLSDIKKARIIYPRFFYIAILLFYYSTVTDFARFLG